MELRAYELTYELEESHWWYSGMRNITLSILEKFLKKQKENFKILDIGCGTGYNALLLKKFGAVSAVDSSKEAIMLCKKRGIKAKLARAEKLPFKQEFDLVTVFDVLYHKNVDDEKALKEIYRVLKPEGFLFIREPAFKFLWSSHDELVHGRQRYSKTELKNKLEKAGFKIIRITYANFFLFIPILIARKLTKKTSLEKTKLNFFFKFILKIEASLIKHINFPFGTSAICLARK